MLDVMEEKKNSVLRVVTDISESKSLSNGDSLRSLKENSDSPPPPSLDEVRNSHQKRLLHKKNQLHPLFVNHPYRFAGFQVPRAASSRPKPKDLSQRIVSAKLLQIKELRNQLTLTQHQLNEVTNENRFLKTLQKRQETALRKYEGHEARLPQLIQTHSEELRVLNTKLKQVKLTNQRLVEKLKAAESQLSSLQQQNCHLMELSRNQQLGEREALALQVQNLHISLCDKTNTIQILTRKVDLEKKNYKHELALERSKRNDVERKLSLAMQTIENLKDQIEAKEKCMNSIVPSRYVRGPSQPSLNSSRLTRSQIPRKQNSVHTHMNTTSDVNQTPRRSSNDQTGDEMDIVESRNSKTTSDSTRTLSGTIFPKIKPQMSSKTLRNQFKLSSKRNINKDRSSTNNDSPDYSSSFASVDVSLKDIRKNSDSESEKLLEAKQIEMTSRRNSSRSRKYSVDSGVINKSDSGKVTQRTDQSRLSSSKTRRNSISVCPSRNGEEVEQYSHQENLAAREEAHKAIREELRELEDKLLQGKSFLDKSRTKKSIDLEASKEEFKNETPRDGTDDEYDLHSRENLDDVTWNEIHERVKAESDAAESKLEDYYNTLEKSELNLEDAEHYIALEQEQKERLLKALKEIDREAGGISSASSTEDHEPSSSHEPTRRKSDGFNYNFSKNIENLHRGRPVHDKIKIPVIEKMKKEEQEYLSESEKGKKNKADFMKELFGKLDVSLQSESFPNSERPKEIERLVQLNRSFD